MTEERGTMSEKKIKLKSNSLVDEGSTRQGSGGISKRKRDGKKENEVADRFVRR